MNLEKKVLSIAYERQSMTLSVSTIASGEDNNTDVVPLLEFSFAKLPESGYLEAERTIGQLVLYALEKTIPGGLGFGEYSTLLDRIQDENMQAFSNAVDLNNLEDKYNFAVVLFAHARDKKSWVLVEQAIEMFRLAAAQGHREAIRFLDEDLPLVLPRIEKALKQERNSKGPG